MNLLRTAVLLLFLFITTIYGQITITSGDILDLIGESHLVEGDASGSLITVDVGSAGANQTWDFSGISIPDPEELTLDFVSPGNTPFADDFPTANLAFRIPFNEFGFNATGYNYVEVQSNQVTSLGFAAEITEPDSSIVNYAEEEVVELPLTYGDSWTSASADTFEYLPGFGIITITNTESTVDGYGTVKLKAGDFECLRLKDLTEEINLTLIGGQVSFADTTNYIAYSWVGKESFLLAEIESTEGEEDPNFTTAEYVQLTSSTDGTSALVEDDLMIRPKNMVLHTNYPNPFNPSTTIRFDIPQAGSVQLAIYDINGRLISTLIDGDISAGSHQVTWNGRDASGTTVASGVYIYRLQNDGKSQSRKLMLVR